MALGAQKGQAWIMRNRAKLTVPVVSHLGATLNFLAGTVKRAPVAVRKFGLEWLWRIKEEPKLAPRYLSDGRQLSWLLLTRVLPLSLWLRRGRAHDLAEGNGVWLDVDSPQCCTVTLAGNLADARLAPVAEAFRGAVQSGRDIRLDFGRLKSFEMGFAGRVLMLEKVSEAKPEPHHRGCDTVGPPGPGLVWLGISTRVADRCLRYSIRKP